MTQLGNIMPACEPMRGGMRARSQMNILQAYSKKGNICKHEKARIINR